MRVAIVRLASEVEVMSDGHFSVANFTPPHKVLMTTHVFPKRIVEYWSVINCRHCIRPFCDDHYLFGGVRTICVLYVENIPKEKGVFGIHIMVKALSCSIQTSLYSRLHLILFPPEI